MVLEVILDKPSSPVQIPGSQGLGHQKQGTNAEPTKRRPKRRAADARIRKFHDLYESTGETLGHGSFGHVHAYRNRLTNREVAVKVVDKQQRRSRNKVLKEIEIFHYCRGHENILQLIEYFEEDDRFYLIFEKMTGGSLFDVLTRLPRHRRVTKDECRRVIGHLANALLFLHSKGVAHRDLKPENVLVSSSDDDDDLFRVVKLCDFDLASGVQVDLCSTSPQSGSCDSNSFVTTPELQSPVGSADFMAPEVVDVWQERAWTYDKRCDIWSLGVIIYMLLCGYKPFYTTRRCSNKWCEWREGGFCAQCQDSLFDAIRLGEFDFPLEDWRDVSPEAKDLVRLLLVRDPEARLTAEQILSHPWLSSSNTTDQQFSTNHVHSSAQQDDAIGQNITEVHETSDMLNGLKLDNDKSLATEHNGCHYEDEEPMINSKLNNNSSSLASAPMLNRCQSSPAFFTSCSDTGSDLSNDTTLHDIIDISEASHRQDHKFLASKPISIPGSCAITDEDLMTTSDLASSLLSEDYGSWLSLFNQEDIFEASACSASPPQGPLGYSDKDCCVLISGAALVIGCVGEGGSLVGEYFSGGEEMEDFGIICWGDVGDSDEGMLNYAEEK